MRFPNPFKRAPTELMREYDVQTEAPFDAYSQLGDRWNAYFTTPAGANFVSLKPNQSERSTRMITPYMNLPGVEGSYKQHSSAQVNPHVYLRMGSGTPGIPGGVPLAAKLDAGLNKSRPQTGGGPGSILAMLPVGGTIFGVVDS